MVKAMSDALIHRGPDGSGVWFDNGVALAHRRLAIIDLAGSPQPMVSHDDSAVIVFNGEIYNFRELRRELQTLGVQFKTAGDTEVLLAAWQYWGADCLRHLNGMFAFAIYDKRRRQLFLARDRLGVKPLYYTQLSDGAFAFASELKGLLAIPALRRTMDPLALEDYFTWGYIPDHRCFIKDVRKLAAGHYLCLEFNKHVPEPIKWWDVNFHSRRETARRDEASVLVQLREILKSSVASRMISDVPLGAFLSGGVDSSAVVALMSEISDLPVHTCSIGFDASELDETPYAQLVADTFVTDHKTRQVDPNDYGAIDVLAAMFDEPFADASALPSWRVSQLARENVTVALTGDGADEAFGGYRRHIFHRHEESARAFIPAALRKPVFGALGALWPKADWAPRALRAKATFLALAADGDTAYASAIGVMSARARHRLYTDAFHKSLDGYIGEQDFIEMMAASAQHNGAATGLDRAQYADLKFWLPGDILTKLDRTTMAVSLEAREPLLDYRLVEFAAALPVSMRVNANTGKYALKKAMEKYLPKDILYRPKQGFVTPISQWFRGPLAAHAREFSHKHLAVKMGILEPKVIATMAGDHIAGQSDYGRELWQLAMLDRVMRHLGVAE